MGRVRRPRYLGFVLDDTPFLDLERLAQGEVEPVTLRHIVALSILTGEEVELRPEELDLVLETPAAEWVEPRNPDAARALARQGVLLSDDEDDEELCTLRRRHEQLERSGWSRAAALFRFLSRWRQVDYRTLTGEEDLAELAPRSDAAMRALITRYGAPPPAAHSRGDATSVRPLPAAEPDGVLFDVLRQRRTTRAFAPTPLGLEELATVLSSVFGYTGAAELGAGETAFKRTSPSGGALHPVEAYPLAIDVDGLHAGLYHYSGNEHALELLEPLDRDAASVLALDLVCGQTYFDGVQALVLLTARFDRAFWKYRNQPKGLPAVWMDAGHLSQTLYLVATALGLGAFVTLAVNDADADDRLGLDGVGEGTLAACGIGNPASEPSPVDAPFDPLR